MELDVEKVIDRHVARQYRDLSASQITSINVSKPCSGIIIEFAPTVDGQMTGTFSVYLSEAIGGYPYRVLSAGNVYAMPLEAPEGAVVTIVPAAGAIGTAIVTLTKETIQPFIGTV